MEKVRPLLIPAALLVLGILIGVGVGYSTVQISDTGPWQLHADFQARYVMAVADAYAADGNVEVALTRLGYLCRADGATAAINAAAALPTTSAAQQANLQELGLLTTQWAASTPDVCVNYPTSGTLRLIRQFIPIIGVLAILAFAGYVGYNLYLERQSGGPAVAAAVGAPSTPKEKEEKKPAPPTLGGSRASSKAPPKIETAKSPAARGAAIAATTEKTDFAASGDPPLVQFVTTYLEGDDLFDDSFSIETSAGDFLGETGVGISETLGVGEPKRVTAMEVWLFDKNDIRTVTKVLMSDHAFNDEVLKSKLAPKGEAILANPDAVVTLETAALRVQAKVIDIEYGSGPVPPNSFFKRITIELAAWKRAGATTSTPTPPPVTPRRPLEPREPMEPLEPFS